MVVRASDVARRAGTSTATVSYVFNDGPRPVAAGTRERVLRAAEELGYRPNKLARALRTAESGMVGVIVPYVTSPFFGELARHLEQTLAASGKLMILANSETGAAQEDNIFEAFFSAQVDGLIVIASENEAPAMDMGGARLVYVFNAPPNDEHPFIKTDNELSVRLAVEHLRHHGYPYPDMLGGPRDLGPVGERVAAWRRYDDAHEGSLLRSEYSPESAERLVRTLHATESLPRSLLVASDEQAVGVLSGCYALGVRIPDDLAVITLDGTPLTAHTSPPLTAIKQPIADLAWHAVRALFVDPSDATVRAHLVPRASCGCATPPNSSN